MSLRWIVCLFKKHDKRPLASVSYIPVIPGVEMQPEREFSCRRCGRRLKG